MHAVPARTCILEPSTFSVFTFIAVLLTVLSLFNEVPYPLPPRQGGWEERSGGFRRRAGMSRGSVACSGGTLCTRTRAGSIVAEATRRQECRRASKALRYWDCACIMCLGFSVQSYVLTAGGLWRQILEKVYRRRLRKANFLHLDPNLKGTDKVSLNFHSAGSLTVTPEASSEKLPTTANELAGEIAGTGFALGALHTLCIQPHLRDMRSGRAGHRCSIWAWAE